MVLALYVVPICTALAWSALKYGQLRHQSRRSQADDARAFVEAQLKSTLVALSGYALLWEHLGTVEPDFPVHRQRLCAALSAALARATPPLSSELPGFARTPGFPSDAYDTVAELVSVVGDSAVSALWEHGSYRSLYDILRVVFFQEWDPEYRLPAGLAA
ncbi:hypothetical protein F6X40_09810 [Paraburkholderia sp. UCT31]|uniref:hypothetical protein n=1 Tax=Paraburkholderia sp. UCT31 TaxID=2615209 RepID=UPI001655A5ED|nr:hypothetical protein [Paraburkholderia sp. UCT31]MBC8737103.1 hypothetical protein [Paraburkholderia sp. UCT31]